MGARVGSVVWPTDTVLACIVRGAQPLAPTADDTLETGDELVLVMGSQADEESLQHLLSHGAPAVPAIAAGDPLVAPELAAVDGLDDERPGDDR